MGKEWMERREWGGGPNDAAAIEKEESELGGLALTRERERERTKKAIFRSIIIWGARESALCKLCGGACRFKGGGGGGAKIGRKSKDGFDGCGVHAGGEPPKGTQKVAGDFSHSKTW